MSLLQSRKNEPSISQAFLSSPPLYRVEHDAAILATIMSIIGGLGSSPLESPLSEVKLFRVSEKNKPRNFLVAVRRIRRIAYEGARGKNIHCSITPIFR